MKYSNEELLLMDPVEVYKLRLEGVINKFPRGFFKEDEYVNMDVCIELIKYLIEKKLKWTDEEVCKNLSQKTFKENGLGGMFNNIFNDSPYEALNNAYPGKYKPWQLNKVPQDYWNKETTGKEATIWLIEEKKKWTDEEVCKYLSLQTFKENGLWGMLDNIFNNSPYEALNNAYPGKFKPWQLRSVPQDYWNKETTGKEATIWLIEEKKKWSGEEVCKNLSAQIFKENGLWGMLTHIFNSSPYEALNNAYPGKFKPWQLRSVPQDYWNKETTGKEATIWLVEKKKKWTDEEVCKYLSLQTFKENGLGGMIYHIFNNSPYEALNNAYPGKFKPWQLRSVPQDYWNKETTGKEATIWLIEEKKKWTDEEVCKNLSQKTFKENRLYGMLTNIFNGSPYEALNNAYPGKFKPWQLNKVPQDYWNKETTGKEATIWLIEEKKKWTDEEVCKNLSVQTFYENGLCGVLHIFNDSPYEALNNAYPGKYIKIGKKIKLAE